MKLHRFYLPKQELTQELWMDEPALFHQWSRVLRFQPGRELVLFNEKRQERLYRLERYGNDAAKLTLVTELEPLLPARDVYLCFSILKKDKNDWVLQKATELGVSHFVPLLCERTEKIGWDTERAQRIVIEAAEQCGRADIPRLREPLKLTTLIAELQGQVDVVVAEQGAREHLGDVLSDQVAVLVGPEGGWSETEKQHFEELGLRQLALSRLTLRAETAAIAAAALLQ